jgi:hypothetical protein
MKISKVWQSIRYALVCLFLFHLAIVTILVAIMVLGPCWIMQLITGEPYVDRWALCVSRFCMCVQKKVMGVP